MSYPNFFFLFLCHFENNLYICREKIENNTIAICWYYKIV